MTAQRDARGLAKTQPGAGTVKRRPRTGRVRDEYGNRIRALARRGHTPWAIAQRLGLDPATVRKILSDAGLLKPRGTHLVREKIHPLVERGLTLQAAANVFGVSPSLTRYHYLTAGGKPLRLGSGSPSSPRHAAELLRRLETYREPTGSTWKEVASRCGLSVGPFSGWRAGKRVPSDYTLEKVEGFLSRDKG